jgi:riboflavin kinase/FMN adenylyltransferase
MDIIKKLVSLKHRYPRAVLTMGNFDGMHVGHKRIIDRVVAEAGKINGTSIVLTFAPHPIKVLKPEITDLLLTSEEHKIKLIERLGVDVCISLDFTSIANMRAKEFVSEVLCNYLHVQRVYVGFNYRFGVGQQGDVKLLRQVGNENNFSVSIINPVKISGEIVSSTKVRECIKEGNLGRASELLGRRYSVMGSVSRGCGISRDIDFPTANVYCDNEITPPEGVYAAYAMIYIDNKQLIYKAVLDARKQSNKFFLEVHIFKLKTDLYGKTIEVFFIKKLRDRYEFQRREDAKKQIICDAAQAMKILEKYDF